MWKKRQKVFIFALHTQCIKKVQPKIDRSQEDHDVDIRKYVFPVGVASLYKKSARGGMTY